MCCVDILGTHVVSAWYSLKNRVWHCSSLNSPLATCCMKNLCLLPLDLAPVMVAHAPAPLCLLLTPWHHVARGSSTSSLWIWHQRWNHATSSLPTLPLPSSMAWGPRLICLLPLDIMPTTVAQFPSPPLCLLFPPWQRCLDPQSPGHMCRP
jgi:hypothetical protein